MKGHRPLAYFIDEFRAEEKRFEKLLMLNRVSERYKKASKKNVTSETNTVGQYQLLSGIILVTHDVCIDRIPLCRCAKCDNYIMAKVPQNKSDLMHRDNIIRFYQNLYGYCMSCAFDEYISIYYDKN